MNNFNNFNGRQGNMPIYNGSNNPYSYGNPQSMNMAYQQPFAPYTQNNGFNQQPQQTELPIQYVLYLTNKEAESFVVNPNNKVLIIDKANGMAYLKSANNIGESTTQLFKYVSVGADGKMEQPIAEQGKVEYITKQELNQYGFATKEQLKAVLSKVENLQKYVMGENENGK